MKIKVKLSIGLNNCDLTDILEIEDEEIEACKSKEEVEELKEEYLRDWMWDYIDSSFSDVEDT